jgi:hypothetical protein
VTGGGRVFLEFIFKQLVALLKNITVILPLDFRFSISKKAFLEKQPILEEVRSKAVLEEREEVPREKYRKKVVYQFEHLVVKLHKEMAE